MPRLPTTCRRHHKSAGLNLVVVTTMSAALLPTLAAASPWGNDPQIELPDAGQVTQKVELVDINHDGWVDIVFANSGGDKTGGEQTAQLNQLLLAEQDGSGFVAQDGVFEVPDNAYAIKAGDLDGDGDADLVVGVNFAGTSYVLLHEDDASFSSHAIDASAGLSVGDLELGDVDGDGDLDIVATDWGANAPHGDPGDPGAPVRLWLGNGDGTFAVADMNLPMGMENLSAWSFDLELVDLDNDDDLDVMVASRGVGWALVFANDGGGVYSTFAAPALAGDDAKQDNAAFTPMDFDGDGAIDVLSLRDGVGEGGDCIDVMGVETCARRNSVLINDGTGQFADNPGGAWWTAPNNPPRLDFDAATLDFDSDGRPDFVTTGLRLDPMTPNARLFLNDGTTFTPAPAPLDDAFPPELARSFGLMFADFDRDRREDVAVAQRDAALPNYVLFGRDDPMGGIAADTSPPRIHGDKLEDALSGPLRFGDRVEFTIRVDDAKTPTHWHDFEYKGQSFLQNIHLYGDGAERTLHGRRLPYLEFALGLADPADLEALNEDDPKKYVVPSIWVGEALWRVGFVVPDDGKSPDTLTWRYCAVDAAGNKGCVGPFQVTVQAPADACGDGVVQAWEDCDDDSPSCVMCVETCGNGICDPNEEEFSCPDDCGTGPGCGDGVCAVDETPVNCASDCAPPDVTGDADSVGPGCGDGVCATDETPVGCPDDCAPPETSDGPECPDGASVGPDGECQSGGAGCGCVSVSKDSRDAWASLLLLGVVGVRRSRKEVRHRARDRAARTSRLPSRPVAGDKRV